MRKRILALRADGHEGLRGAEIAVQRVLAVAQWRRDVERLPAHACVAPRRWRDAVRADWRVLAGEATDAEAHRPRHTLEEIRKILDVAEQVDPRFGLLVALGAELPQAWFVWMERSGSFSHIEEPERVMELVRGFLRDGGDR